MTQNATVWLPYAQMQTCHTPLEVVAAQGTTLTLKDGRQLVDGLASWWTACHGYNHPHINNAVQQQASKFSHVMLGGLIHSPAKTLAARLTNLLPGDLRYVFFSESGSVAVEVAMKMALQYWINKQEPMRKYFVYFQYGYHGDTFFTMSVSDPQDGVHPPFQAILPKQYCQKIPESTSESNVFASWLTEHAPSIAGMIIEPLVQGAGGMKMHESPTLAVLCALCQTHDILFIVDEIFTGFGRTGSMFAIEQAAIVPDIVCLSKALTGGVMPLAATIANQAVYNAFLGDDHAKALMHGTTYMGLALGCAAANASLDLFEQETSMTKVALVEKLLHKELSPLRDVPGVKAVRVKGAIGVVQLAYPLIADLNWFKLNFIEQGVWCRPFGDIVYTTPALNINQDALLKITGAMVRLIKEWSTRRFKK